MTDFSNCATAPSTCRINVRVGSSSPDPEMLRTAIVRAFPVPAHTRTLAHRWRERQRLPDVRVL
jgi:hypothetical protein